MLNTLAGTTAAKRRSEMKCTTNTANQASQP